MSQPSTVTPRSLARAHWPEYGIEAACLGLFMVSACVLATALGHPASPLVVTSVRDQRLLMGIAMGLTAVGIIYSRMGRRSGAHMNPAVTLVYLRLGKVAAEDAFFYMSAQFSGGLAGVIVSRLLLGPALGGLPVRYAVTVPGPSGVLAAFAAELTISFVLMMVVLAVSNVPRLNRYTGLIVGMLVMVYIWVEAPLSGMSLNPARTLASAVPAMEWTGIWIYFVAPPAGMLIAAEVWLRWRGAGSILCARLCHDQRHRCVFRCNYPASGGTNGSHGQRGPGSEAA